MSTVFVALKGSATFEQDCFIKCQITGKAKRGKKKQSIHLHATTHLNSLREEKHSPDEYIHKYMYPIDKHLLLRDNTKILTQS